MSSPYVVGMTGENDVRMLRDHDVSFDPAVASVTKALKGKGFAASIDTDVTRSNLVLYNYEALENPFRWMFQDAKGRLRFLLRFFFKAPLWHLKSR